MVTSVSGFFMGLQDLPRSPGGLMSGQRSEADDENPV
jgi:hypothetical protein